MSTILTRSGRYFDFHKPDEFDYRVSDIAHALSNICRFTGHVSRFYSVATHSVLVSRLLPKELQLEGLMHDAAEAFVGDMSYPLKTIQPGFKDIEKGVDRAIRRKFGLPEKMTPGVKRADLALLSVEKDRLMPGNGENWEILDGLPMDLLTVAREYFAELLNTGDAFGPVAARGLFLQEFRRLTE